MCVCFVCALSSHIRHTPPILCLVKMLSTEVTKTMMLSVLMIQRHTDVGEWSADTVLC